MEEPIASLQNRAVKEVVKLRTSRHRRDSGLFVAEGAREISRALACGLVPKKLYVCLELLTETAAQTVASEPIRPVTEAVMQKMAYHQRPEGLLGVFEAPREMPLADLLATPMSPDPAGAGTEPRQGLFLVAVGTEKPGNLGAMARTVWALGGSGLIAAGAPVDRLNPNAIRSSTGAVFCLPIAEVSEADAIAGLQAANAHLVVSTPEGGRPLNEVTFASTSSSSRKGENESQRQERAAARGPVAVVVGPEDTGLSPAWLEAGHERVQIPMRTGPVDSLNASVAAGLLMWAASQSQ